VQVVEESAEGNESPGSWEELIPLKKVMTGNICAWMGRWD